MHADTRDVPQGAGEGGMERESARARGRERQGGCVCKEREWIATFLQIEDALGSLRPVTTVTWPGDLKNTYSTHTLRLFIPVTAH